MKTIMRIIIILLVASVVAGAFSLAVNNPSSASESGVAVTTTGANGQSFQPINLPEGGGRGEGSIAGGLAGVLATLAKLTGIIIVVLLIQKAFSLLANRKFIPIQT